MNQNPNDWQPITFQGIEFPSSLMAITVLESILKFKEEQLGAWLWKLTICQGGPKSESAEECWRHAQRVVDLLLDNKAAAIDGIREFLAIHGLDPERTYVEWITSMQRIVEVSSRTAGECLWSAPTPPGVDVKTSAKQFLNRLESQRKMES